MRATLWPRLALLAAGVGGAILVGCSAILGIEDFGPATDGGLDGKAPPLDGPSASEAGADGLPAGDATSSSDGAPTDASDGGIGSIYAVTDDSLYVMDPTNKSVTLVGTFTGFGGTTGDTNATDCAVASDGTLFVISESALYRAVPPTTVPATVQLTVVSHLALQPSQKFVALGVTPAGVLGANGTFVGGDATGVLWSIDGATGATKRLGSFGSDPTVTGNTLSLSGDLVFFLDGNSTPRGLATIRTCQPGAPNPLCTGPSDYLAAIDMTALANAFASGTPAATLLSGVYGSTSSSLGPGAGHKNLYGLAAWDDTVYAFARYVNPTPPLLLSIDQTGVGTPITNSFSFVNGWSGAGVSPRVSLSFPLPPPLPIGD